MPSYENEKCPVCGRTFEDGDDIVTCPECGTPHHRECYKSIGHCRNEELHKSGYVFKRTQKSEADTSGEAGSNGSAPIGSYFNPYEGVKTNASSSGTKKCISCGEEIDANAPFCSKCGAKQPDVQNRRFSQGVEFKKAFGTGYEKSDEKIDGESADDIASAIRTNVPRFMEKFKSRKKLSWNWGAFFFGSYYLFFRKMYKQGALFLALELAISLTAQGLYADAYSKFSDYIISNASAIQSGSLSDNAMNKLVSLANGIAPMAMIIAVSTLVIHIFIAVLSDGFYKKKIFATVKDVNEKLSGGADLEQVVPLYMVGDTPPLSKEDLKRMYLGKLGGTSLLAPVFAYFVLDLITSLISKL